MDHYFCEKKVVKNVLHENTCTLFSTFHISYLCTFFFHIFIQFHPPQQPFNFSFQTKLNFSSYFSVSTIASNDTLLYATYTVCISEFLCVRLCFSHICFFFWLTIFQFVCFSFFPHAHKSCSRKVDSLYWHRIFGFCFSSLFSLSHGIFLLFLQQLSFFPLLQPRFPILPCSISKGIHGSTETNTLS